ncbi:MAG TPA: DNA gyrase subunit A [Candidatus Pacearchaeota archaeon]|nr:DNA gyrase subunit A [Candidatus Pacearchaeota archaeon]HOK94013.1 DNA gyrase subunit A [Candidatus Pacearchaeota archaeon]HPO75084.1 DNA gyrase subunit A [Candidatus Pacearchaeota archaeon]
MPIQKRDISNEVKEAYLDYAMSVIISRALPDARDGLKPVHRRILYAMYEDGLRHNAKFRKCASVIGSVLARYHPHGDQAVYDALARMAQDFSLRYPLVEGQGNFGSIDGDSPAAYRYTEARLSKIGEEMLRDIEKNTVDFMPNYDGTRKEPVVLPSPLPQLLLNGSLGIAVGMATNIPPHNLSELCDGLVYLLKNEDATTEELCEIIKGPDFPTGGQIFDKSAIVKAYENGRGPIVNRGKAEIIEKKKDIFEIQIREIPYGIQKSALLQEMATLAREKKIQGIKNIIDESDKEGLRITIELKKDASPKKILNQLYKHTSLEKTFYLNLVALADGRQPATLSLKEAMENFLSHRREVVKRRTEFDLQKAKERIHILLGLKKALLHIDEVIDTIKKSKDREDAFRNLISKFKFSEIQANVILETKLQALARLEQQKILNELEEKKKLVEELENILSTKGGIEKVVEKELIDLKEKYGDERKTEVIPQKLGEFKEEDLIPEEENILILTKGGYVKRLSPRAFKAQKRGGKGVLGLALREEDKVEHFLFLSSHDEVCFFTNLGKVFKIPAYIIPESERQGFGKGILNFLELSPGEEITSLVVFPKVKNNIETSKIKYFVMVTKNGIIKKTKLEDFEQVRRSGLRAIKLEENDQLVFARPVGEDDEILLASSIGNVIRFKEKDLRPMGRNAAGVRGMKLQPSTKNLQLKTEKENDRIVGMEIIDKSKIKNQKSKIYLLTLSENGFGKRTDIQKFRLQKRGGKGIIGIKITEKTGSLAQISLLSKEEEELIVISEKGQTIRTKIKQIPVLGRSSQGVKIIKLKQEDKVVSAITI